MTYPQWRMMTCRHSGGRKPNKMQDTCMLGVGLCVVCHALPHKADGTPPLEKLQGCTIIPLPWTSHCCTPLLGCALTPLEQLFDHSGVVIILFYAHRIFNQV